MRRMLGWGLLLVMGWSQAQTTELRMPVKGEIGIDPQGNVFDYTISTLLTPEVKQVVDRSVRQWKFEPVIRDGKPGYAKSRMDLTLIAHKVDAGYQLQVEHVRFTGSRESVSMVPPRYPSEAIRQRISADVLLAIRIDRDGKVQDAMAVQSALPNTKGSERVLNRWRKLFEDASVEVAKRWRFKPADSSLEEENETTVIVPVDFRMEDMAGYPPAGWRYESAGPARPIPWLEPGQQTFDATGLKDGEVLALDFSIKLKTNVVGIML